MQAQVLSKVAGQIEKFDTSDISLTSPSIVQLGIAPEAVNMFKRHGDDLQLVLTNGDEVLIRNFFVPDAQGNRSDLVLQDDAGVYWWGQYTSPWESFHFTEIESDLFGAAPWSASWLGGLLGLGAIGAAAGGGGGGGGGGDGGGGSDGGGGGGGNPPAGPNRAPEALGSIAARAGLDAEGGTHLDVSTFFADADGDALRYSAAGLPPGLTIDPVTGVISGVIDPSASQGGTTGAGDYEAVITATDPSGATATQTVQWTVTNPAPTANDDTVTVAEDTTLTGNVLGNDVDPDGDPLTVTGFSVDIDGDTVPELFAAGDTATIAGVGTLQLKDDGSYTFTPDADWHGTVPTVSYTIDDGEGGTDIADLVITVTAVNDAPVPVGTIGNQAGMDAAAVTDLDVKTFFDDVDGDALSYSATGLPDGLTIDAATGIISGTPTKSASQGGTGGVYTVVVTAEDPSGATATQTFTWTVSNPAPTANDDTVTVAEDTVLKGNVLTGTSDGTVVSSGPDTDPDGDTLTVVRYTVEGKTYAAGATAIITGGMLTLNGDGGYTFTPTADWNGTVPAVSYTISDGEGGADTAVLQITVTAVNDAPEAVGTIADRTNQDADGGIVLDVRTAFRDVDGPLNYSVTGLPAGLAFDPVTGLISGTLAHDASQGGAGGVHTVIVTATDGDGALATQTFAWTVGNPAPVAVNDAAMGAEDTVITGNVLGNDIDPDGDPLTVTGFSVDIDGDTVPDVFTAGDTATIAGVGTLELNGDGSYTFTPDADWNGTVPTVSYTIDDGDGGSDTANLVITVTPVNDAPEAVGTIPDANDQDADSGISLDVKGFFGDADGDALSYSATGLPAGLTIDPATGLITGVIDRSASQGGTTGTGDYTVIVTAKDPSGATVTQTFTWNVGNPAPTAQPDTGTTGEDAVLAVDASHGVLRNDNDPDGDPLTVTGITNGADTVAAGSTIAGTSGGSFVIHADGSYTFEPGADFQDLATGQSRPTTVTYTVEDGDGASTTATLTITVTGTNDAPLISSDPAQHAGTVVEAGHEDDGTVVPGTPDAEGQLAVTDPDHATHVWSVVGTADATYGAFSLDPVTGKWTYTLDDTLAATQGLKEGESVELRYTVRATDPQGGYADQVVTVTVQGTNDAPAAAADVNEVKESGVKDGGNVAEAGTPQVGGNVLANDSDVDDGAVLTVAGVAVGGGTPAAGNVGTVLTGTYGTLTLSANGSYTYTLDNGRAATQALASGDTAPETFTYAVTDEFGATRETTLTITIHGTNDGPVIDGGPATAALAETDAALTANGTFTVSDVDLNDDVSAAVTRVVAGGDGAAGAPDNAALLAMLGVTAGNVLSGATRTAPLGWTFDSAAQAFDYLQAGQVLTLTYTVQVEDGQGATDTETVTITITGTNDVPAIGGATTGGVTEDAASPLLSTTGTLTIADPDAGESFFQAGAAQPVGATLGNLTITAGGVWTYRVDNALVQHLGEGETRDEVFTVRGVDGTPQTITVTITGTNDGPTIGDVADFGFTEAANASAQDLSASGTVSFDDVDVNDDVTVSSALKTGAVWSGGTLDAGLQAALEGGFSVTALADGKDRGSTPWAYTVSGAALDFLGAGETITLTYTITVEDSEGVTATDDVTITITGTNDAPAVSGDTAGTVVEAGFDAAGDPMGTPTVSGQLTAADPDANDTHTWTVDGMPDTHYGTFSVDADGRWTFALDDTKAATQALNAGDSVVLTYVVRATDTQGASDTETVTITITGSNDQALISGTATGAVVEAGDLNNSTLNRPDAQGALRIEDVDDGEARFQVPASLNGTYGTFTFDAATGEWSYRLDNSRPVTQALAQNQQVTDTLTVTSADGTATQDIVVTITGSNDIPTVTDGAGSVTEDVDVDASDKLTASGTVANSQALTITDVDAGEDAFNPGSVAFAGNSLSGATALGTLTVNADGTWDYAVDNNLAAIQALGAGETIIERFTVLSADGTATSTVTITITGTNEAPVAAGDSASGAEDTVVTGNVLGNDSDPNGDPLTVTVFSVDTDGDGTPEDFTAGDTATIVGVGTLTLNGDGSYTFTPDANWNGTVPTVSYTISDGKGGTDTADLVITVTPVNDAPVPVGAVADQTGVDAVVVADLDMTAYFDDVEDGTALTYTATGLPDGLTIDAATGIISGTPTNSASQGGAGGVHTVVVTATDSEGTSTTQTFTWTVSNPAPAASDDTVEVAEDTVLTGNVLTGTSDGTVVTSGPDSDPDGDPLTVVRYTVEGKTYAAGATAVITGGTLTLNGDGGYTFTPAADWNGTVPPVSYTISDGNGGVDTAVLQITVTAVNDAPEAVGTIEDQANRDADSGILLDIKNYFRDVDGPVTYSATGLPEGLTVDSATGLITGTIDRSASQDGASGVHAVVITATDGSGATATQTFDWAVTNPAPVAGNDSASGAEDTVVTGNVLGNDSDPDGDTLTVTGFSVDTGSGTTAFSAGDTATIAGVGTLQLNGDGSYTFTPDADWNGTVPTVSYTISDGEGGTDIADLVITVTPVNDVPDAVGTVPAQTGVDAIAATDLDMKTYFDDVEDGTALTYTATGLPDGLSIDAATGIISGTPTKSASQGGTGGVHTVVVTATDSEGASTTQTFTWTVTNPAPLATDDTANGDEDTAVTGNVLDNDNDPDGDSLTVTGFSVDTGSGTPTDFVPGATATITDVGTLTLNGDGSYTFTPDADWNGTVPAVSYTISDGEGGTDTADLVITVTPVNDAPVPVGTVPDQSDTDALAVTDLDMTAYFDDVEEGTALTYTATGLPDGLSIDPVTGVISGTLEHDASQGGAGGVHTVVVTATDGDGATTTQTFTWTVDNPAPTANDDTVTVAEDTVLTGNVLTDTTGGHSADTDPDGDTLTVVRYTVEGKTYAAGATAVITGGTLTLNGDGGYTFNPTADWNGTVPAVTYTISDGNGGVDTAVLQITVTAVNDPAAITGDDAGAVTEAGGVANAAAGSPTTGGQLIITDVDTGENRFLAPDPADLTGTYGAFVFDPLTGVWSYQLDNTKAGTQALNAGDTITDTLTVTSQDGTATETITVTITGTNDAPVVTSDAAAAQGSVVEAGIDASGDPIGSPTANGTLTADDVDAEDDPASLVWSLSDGGNSAIGAYGSLTLDAAGEWEYTLSDTQADGLKAGETRTETFTAIVTDARGATAQQVITITITGSNDAPTVSGADTGDVAEDGVQQVSGQLDKADVDIGDTHTWTALDGGSGAGVGAYGTLTVDATGKWTYVLDNAKAQAIPEGQTVQDTITVRVADAAGATAEQIVTITITGENDAPQILGSSTLTGDVTELPDGDPDEGSRTHEATGTIAFSDVDTLVLADTHLVQSVTAHGAGYLGSLTLGAVNNAADTVVWTFQVADSAIDHLAQGEVLTQSYDVVISDGHGGTAVTTVTVTITGANDDPVIDVAKSDLAATVTEITDGAAGENTHVHGHQGYVRFSDVDTLDVVHTVAVAPKDTDYLGDFTITPVDNVNDRVQWQFTVADGLLDTLPEGETITQDYEITISDGHGGTATETVTITLVGTNDRPLVEDDLTLGTVGSPIVQDVLANDDDIDDGDKTRWKVTHVDGQDISEGNPVDIMDGGVLVGTVSLNGAGELTFTPGPAFTGSITLPYTVDDGSGAANATATANWIINVAGVDIVDDTSPGTPGTGDEVLASIDDLENVAITGHTPVGGGITSLTVTDESGNTITIDPADITVNPDGSFSTTADLRTLDDGTLTVTLEVRDSGGHTATVTDTIEKDTVTTVTIDPLLVVDGEVPTITGTGEPGATITLKIDGVDVPGTSIIVDGDGKWTYTPDDPLDIDEVTIEADAADPWGNTSDTTRKVAGLDIEDKESLDLNADILVYEASLPGGSDASAVTESASGTLTIGTSEGGITQLVIGGTIVDGTLSGGTAVTVSQLENLGTTPIPAITTTYGTLTISGYDAGTGVVDYTYTLSGSTQDHSASGTDTVYEGIQIAVVDNNGDTRVGTLKVGVVDDVPEAKDQDSVALDEGGVMVGWDGTVWTGGTANLITGDPVNGIDADIPGADGARVHQVTYQKDTTGATETVEIPDGGSETVTTAYGSLTVHSDGTWSYTSNGVIEHGSAASVNDDFTYTLIDGDGDISSAATQPIVVNDTVPTLGTPDDRTVSEDDLPQGSDTTKESLTATGSLAVTAVADPIDTKLTTEDAPAGLTSGGVDVEYVLSTDGHTLVAYKGAGRAEADKVFTVEVTDPDGVAGTPGYTFTLQGTLDHSGAYDAALELTFGFTAQETEAADGDHVDGSFKVTVADDVPLAVDEAAVSVAEGAGRIGYDGVSAWSTGTANLLDNDALGADGATITRVKYNDSTGTEQTATVDPATGTGALTTQYGTLQVLADGTWWYIPDAQIDHVGGAAVSDPFSYELTDGDGDVSSHWAEQPISITDTAPVAVDDDQATHDEGSVQFGGNVITNDAASVDGGTVLDSVTYTDTSGASQTVTFSASDTSHTVQTPTGELTVNRDGSWTFTPDSSYDHDAPSADRDAGGFSYQLVDADGSLSNTATQPIRITDTDPTAGPVALTIDEKDIKDIGSEGAAVDNAVTQDLAITRAADDISDVVFNAATVTGLTAQALTSGGVPLAYTVSGDGHTLTATAGSGGPTVFTLELNNPTDASGTTQSVTMTLHGPLDHADANGANDLPITVDYEVQDIDSSVNGTLTLKVTDDVPATLQADTPVSVVEDGAAVGSASGGDNLLVNDTLGADGGRVHDISYTDRDGAAVTNHPVPDGSSTTVQTQYGSLTVHSDGTWSYTPLESANHVKATNDTEVTDDFTYRVIDRDGDISASSATQAITVIDTTPEIGDPVDGSVAEANLPLGSDPNAGGAPVQTSGTLDVVPGKDSFGVAFDAGLAGSHPALTSGGESLFYVLTDGGRTLTAHKGDAAGAAVFTVVITNPTADSAGYQFTLHDVLDHGALATLDLDFGVVVTDSDGDTDTDQFTVTVADDKSAGTAAHELDEDGTTTFNTSADATPDNTTIYQGGTEITGSDNPDGGKDYKTEHGTVTVNANGTITYTPDSDYSGTEVFTYETDDHGNIESTDVTMTVNPVSDEPILSPESSINTPEDTAVALGLAAPVVTDATDQSADPGDWPERLGVITLDGFPKGAVLLAADGTTVLHEFNGEDDTQSITIVLSDGPTVAGTTGDLTMTRVEFEGLRVSPPQDAHENFTVEMTVSSYEVDDNGDVAIVDGDPVDGAESTTQVHVYVQAVTDNAKLVFDTTKTNADPEDPDVTVTGVERTITYSGGADGNTEATVTLREDGNFDVRDILSASFQDLDGTEVRSITVTNNTGAVILVNGTALADGASRTIDARAGENGQTGDIESFPAVRIGGVQDYSGDLDGIAITINAQDKDSDGYWDADAGDEVPGTVDGIAEADTADNTVTLNLRVLPGAGDVGAADADTSEDSSVAFLAGVGVTDGDGTGTGTEVIDSVQFDIPTGWTVTAPGGGSLTVDGWTTVGDGVSGTYTIQFNAGPTGTVLDEAARETVLGDFMILPPPHSSADATIPLSIISTDTNTVGGVKETHTATASRSVTITVTPVAEEIGKETALPGADLTMNGDFDYTTAGAEDTWFELNSDGFDMKAPWSNQDASEFTYARLTPKLIAGDGSQPNPNGAKFRWSEDDGDTWKEATYGGEPIDVPIELLHTLEFTAPPNFSGMFEIKVEAYTVDTDEDGGTTSTAVSGEAVLTNVLIKPVADEVTLALNGRASGLEDTPIPLNIRPTSSDPSETFNVTIAKIPAGAILIYGGETYDTNVDPLPQGLTAVTEGGTTTYTLILEGFDSGKSMTIQPPEHSNEDFTLKVSAESVDVLVIPDPDNPGENITYPSTQAGPELDINVSVKGVADPVSITATAPTYAEQELDGGSRTVQLSDLATLTKIDADGSETLTVRITGLPEGFTPSAGILLTHPKDVTGEDRIWLLTEAQFNAATIRVPDNYGGEVSFQIAPVTTENDGNSRTGGWVTVDFKVTPSPEGTVTDTAELVEDTLGALNLSIVHQNGDDDEVLGDVRIKVDDAAGPGFVLYLGDDILTAKTLAKAAADGDISVESDGGVDYYLIPADRVQDLAALGDLHLDDALGGFDFQYQVIDSGYGGVDAAAPVTSDWQDAHFTITAQPVTDQPVLTITDIAGALPSTTVADAVPGGDAEPDTATLTAGDRVTVTLNIASPDSDGSEQVIRVIIDGVPLGVAVTGAEYIGGNQWLLVYQGDTGPSPTLSIDDAGGIALPVEFVVSHQAGGLTDIPVTMTVQVRDRGDAAEAQTEVLSDSVTWFLNTDYTPADDQGPAEIDTWAYNGQGATEDASFRLSDVMDAQVTARSTGINTFTITIKDLPPGTEVSGMARTTIGGEEVWTASASSTDGMSLSQIEGMLAALMDSIRITPPANANDNNAPGGLLFDAVLTTAVLGGDTSIVAEIQNQVIPVAPVTDGAAFSIALDTAEEPDELNESDTRIPFTLAVNNDADGVSGTIVDGKLYLQLSADPAALEGGTLTVEGVEYTLQDVSGVPGLTDGRYYVVDGVSMGDTLNLVYTPAPGTMTAGEVTVNAWVLNQETGATNGTGGDGVLTSSGTGTIEVHISNDGVGIDSAPVMGGEAATATTASLVELDLSVGLKDPDSETIHSILLANVPDGFLVFIGDDADSAVLASNAGGSGGLNTWVISGADGSLPSYVAILPPQYWSGTLNGLNLIVESGETALDESRVDEAQLADVIITPVANGIVITTTTTFGRENGVIPLNLNSAMRDMVDASVKDGATTVAQDDSLETTTLRLTGLGEHASFYLGTAEITAAHPDIQIIRSGSGAGTVYTITGLEQADLDQLGFKQARAALVDQDGNDGNGLQIAVEAWTVENGAPGVESAHTSSTVTLSMSDQLVTTGNDTLIWTGNSINGRSGTDTVQLRSGEDLSGADLAAKLQNIETIDLSVDGANRITGLTPEQVKAIIGSGGTLTIKGSTDDGVTLDGDWSDNGDGSYTGTFDDGGTPPKITNVTLVIDGGVDVELPAGTDGFGGFGASGFGFSAFMAGFDGMEGDGDDGDDDFLFGDDDGELPDWEGVLDEPGTGGEEDGGWLPGGEADDGGLPGGAGAGAPDAAGGIDPLAYVPDPLADDDLEQALHDGQVLA